MAKRIGMEVSVAIGEVVKQGIRRFDPAEVAMVGWIMLHGFASLLTAGTLEAVTGMHRDAVRSLFLEAYSIRPSPPGSGCSNGTP